MPRIHFYYIVEVEGQAFNVLDYFDRTTRIHTHSITNNNDQTNSNSDPTVCRP